MPRRRKKKKSAESSPAFSLTPRLSFYLRVLSFATRKGAAKTRASLARTPSLARQTSVVNFNVPPRENRTSSRAGMHKRLAVPSCSRVSTVALSRKKGVRSKKVREEFRAGEGEKGTVSLRDGNGIARGDICAPDFLNIADNI